MTQLGFNELDESTVYGPEGSYIIYPARRGSDGFNTCAAFLDGSRNQGSQRIALIEGPTLLGIGELAARVRSTGVSPSVVRRAFLPRSTIESQGVSMQRSYNERGTLLAGGNYDLNYRTAE
jgi:hypothetical protein